MKVGIIQSNYIPWRGYFDFINEVDLFIFYDDVKYCHKTWRNRNYIKTSTGTQILSVPVQHDSSSLIENAMIDYTTRWVDKHIKTIYLAYKKAPFFDYYHEEFFDLLSSEYSTISALNINVCKWVMEKLGIKTKTILSSELVSTGDKFNRPLNLLKEIGATKYLAGPSSQEYTKEAAFLAEKISLEYKVYDYLEYPQINGPFIDNLSVIDLLFNCGQMANFYLKSQSPNQKVC